MSVEIRTFVLERDRGGPFHVLPEDAGDFIPPWILERVETIEKEPVLDLLEALVDRPIACRGSLGEEDHESHVAAVKLLEAHGRLEDHPDKREG